MADKEREREIGTEKIFKEIMADNFPNLMKNNLNIQVAQQTLSKINAKRSTPRHNIIKMYKEKILRTPGEKCTRVLH